MRRRLVTVIVIGLLAAAAVYTLTRDEGSDSSDNSTSGDATTVTTAARAASTAPASTAATGKGTIGAVLGDGGETITIKTIHDGDSFIARLPDGEEVEVRLLGINAPDRFECLHHEARKALKALLESGPVTLHRDVSDRDRYGRLLRYVVVDGVVTNVALAEQGLAVAVSTGPDDSRRAEIHAAQKRARAAGLGIWRRDACGTPASTEVAITRVESDPPGRDEANLNGEYAVIRNADRVPVDMSGWKLRDDSTQNRYWFPKGFKLAAGAEVTVHVGSGDDTATDLYWGRRYPVWDNFGDTALLLDPSGNVVSYLDVS